jgi:hypothetical protein
MLYAEADALFVENLTLSFGAMFYFVYTFQQQKTSLTKTCLPIQVHR